jgi:hypothetical protein
MHVNNPDLGAWGVTVLSVPAVAAGVASVFHGWREHKRKEKQGILKSTLEITRASLPFWALTGAIWGLGASRFFPKSEFSLPELVIGGTIGGAVHGTLLTPFIAAPGYVVGRLAGGIKSKLFPSKNEPKNK